MISARLFRKAAKADPAKLGSAEVEPAATVTPAAPAAAAPDEAGSAPQPSMAVADTGAAADAKASAIPDAPRPARLVDGPSIARPSWTTMRLPAFALPAESWSKPAATLATALGIAALGYAGGALSSRGQDKNDLATLRWSEAAAALRDSREEAGRVASEMKFMRTSLDTLKTERQKGEASGKQAQISDRLEKLNGELSGKVAKLSEQIDRVEKAQRDPSRLATLMERLDKIEKGIQVAAATAPTPPPKPVASAPAVATAEVATTGSITEVRPPAKSPEMDHRKVQVEGFVLRDIDDGMALIEARNGRFFEVSAGMTLPGVGKVEAIERRGRQWVVVTPKGYIGER